MNDSDDTTWVAIMLVGVLIVWAGWVGVLGWGIYRIVSWLTA